MAQINHYLAYRAVSKPLRAKARASVLPTAA